ncbi:MAG: DoxX family protein [Opitutus sp.]|nr:DoxX family protein [Opitutus sp.]MCS6274843.1 DoxX family protein [Opitutus sp.]MCS6278400.1 DoxX family protein [Opitutus sp.]MCS6299510.1 DoxX family protein [Opitutus sp.]
MSPRPSSITSEHSARLGGDQPASTDRRAGLFRWVGWGARITLAGLFLWAGIRKAMEPELFLQDIESYELLPYRWAWLMSIWLPFLEITAAVALLMTLKWAQAGALVIGGLLLVFLGAIISGWVRGLTLSCGCFGASTEPANYLWLVVRDVLMLGLVAVVVKTSGGLPTKHTK